MTQLKWSTFTITLIVSIILLLFSILYRVTWYSSGTTHLQSLLQGLLFQETRVQPKSDINVLVGIGSCLDTKADAFQIFNLSGLNTPLPAQHHDVIESEKDLLETFAFFFNEGAAGERYVSDKHLFNKLVNTARKLDNTVWTLGGNAYVIANRMALEGLSVTLAGHIASGDHNLLHPGITALPVDLDTSQEDIHLILEYGTNTTWGGNKTPRANRFIIHSDQNNPRMLALDGFMKFVLQEAPRLIVISGLQMLDNFPFEAGELELQKFLNRTEKSRFSYLPRPVRAPMIEQKYVQLSKPKYLSQEQYSERSASASSIRRVSNISPSDHRYS